VTRISRWTNVTRCSWHRRQGRRQPRDHHGARRRKTPRCRPPLRSRPGWSLIKRTRARALAAQHDNASESSRLGQPTTLQPRSRSREKLFMGVGECRRIVATTQRRSDSHRREWEIRERRDENYRRVVVGRRVIRSTVTRVPACSNLPAVANSGVDPPLPSAVRQRPEEPSVDSAAAAEKETEESDRRQLCCAIMVSASIVSVASVSETRRETWRFASASRVPTASSYSRVTRATLVDALGTRRERA